MNLAAGILAAFYRARDGGGRQGRGKSFHAAIWDVAIMLQGAQYGHPSTQYPISRKHMANPLQVAHKTKDDRWLQIAVPSYDAYYPKFMEEVFGRPDLVGSEKFYPQSALQANLEIFYEILREGFAQKTAAEWTELLAKADLPLQGVERTAGRRAGLGKVTFLCVGILWARRLRVRPPVILTTPVCPHLAGLIITLKPCLPA